MTPVGNAMEEAIKRGATNPPGRSTLHGETHWKCVAMVGFQIGRAESVWDLKIKGAASWREGA